MKVLLIYPPVTYWGSGNVTPHLPLGLVYLATYLKKRGFKVKIIDALAEGKNRKVKKGKFTSVGLKDSDIEKKIRLFKPDVVGISVMFTAFFEDALRVASITKNVNKSIKVVLGGAHPSIDPLKCVKRKNVDFVVKGEGEETLIELLEALEKNTKISNIKGIAYKLENGLTEYTGNRELIANLDDIPFPDWGLVNLRNYQLAGVFSLRNSVFPIVSSRGCPGHCVYCSIHSIWQHQWRGRSAKNVVDEIEQLINKFGANEVSFQDDSLSVNIKRLKEICKLLVKRRINIKWTTPNGIAHWTLTKPILKFMKKAGCYRITFGIESGDVEVRRYLGKPYSLDQAKELIKYANSLGMWTMTTNIIGMPLENEENVKKTVKYAIDCDADWAFFFRLGPRPGTPVYAQMKKEKLLEQNKNKLFSEEVACPTRYLSAKDVLRLQKWAYKNVSWQKIKRFVLRPWLLIKKINSYEDFAFMVRLGWFGFKMMANMVLTNSGITSEVMRK